MTTLMMITTTIRIMIIIPHKINTVVGQYKVNVCINFVIGGSNEGKSGSGYLNYFDRLVSVPCCCFINNLLLIIYTLVKLFQAQTNVGNSKVAAYSISCICLK